MSDEQLSLFASPRVPSAKPPRAPRRKPDPVVEFAADLAQAELDMALAGACRPEACRCDRPLAAVDLDGDRRCVRCGREVTA